MNVQQAKDQNVKLLKSEPIFQMCFQLSSSHRTHCKATIPLSVYFFYCISEIKSQLEYHCLFSTKLQKKGADGASHFLK